MRLGVAVPQEPELPCHRARSVDESGARVSPASRAGAGGPNASRSASSCRATARRCTSSGPSASRSVRAPAYSAASGKSPDTPGAAERLDRAVDHAAGEARRDDLDRGDLLLRVLVADGVHHPRGLQHEQARLLDLDPRLGDPLAHDALRGERPAERDAVAHAVDHQLERALAHPDRAHAVVDAARARAAPGRSRSPSPPGR